MQDTTHNQPEANGGGRLELLAPAGDRAALDAALEAGADAVYFGLTTLNARRRARNFQPDELGPAVEAVHARGARAYLTLNIDLAEREVGQAVRMLELARQARADAVLVRDPALLAMRPHYPELEFHFSTQTCIANSADVAAAAELGATRVVLAREMKLSEIAAASAVPGIETEVFVQGALCFSISGRCLLASWVGGRSGNRGQCTSPCRVPWTVDDDAAGTLLSMHDLATLDRLDSLRKAGVRGLKIEGRLKNAAWVRRAVSLYHRALLGESPSTLKTELQSLGAYTGRAFTCGFLDGQRHGLTGTAEGRKPADALGGEEEESPSFDEAETEGREAEAAAEQFAATPTYDLEITVGTGVIRCRLTYGGYHEEWSVPRTVVRRVNKAVAIGDILQRLSSGLIQDCRLDRAVTDDPDFLMVPRGFNNLVDRISAALHRARKAPDDSVRVELPQEILARLANRRPAENFLPPGKPNRVRLDAKAAGVFLRRVQPAAAIVEGVAAEKLDRLLAACNGVPLIVALPPVFFEESIPGLRSLLAECAAAHVVVEVNSWGGWWLAKQAGVTMESGPGLAVLNSLAAGHLQQLGVRCVTLSLEADRKQLEAITSACPAPCSLVVYGRPPLMTARAKLPSEFLAKPFTDRRGVSMIPRLEHGLWVFRPEQPFNLLGITNDRIRVSHLVMDLVGADDPLAEWYEHEYQIGQDEHDRGRERPFRFNYNRSLA